SLKIFSAVRKGGVSDLPNGSILTDNKTYIDVVVEDGFISLQKIQLSGKKMMGVEEFLRGKKVEGDIVE
ncbi:MAG: methionyl-tRNA formyltransferase, partial [Bacteroidales bacterium]|nr:methionyl-tRNA formyltransferase [Bacteroidales bacterium]